MKKTNYLISVIIPAYNIENYLPRCLESVLNQTYKNLEVIVVSDGSTDNTNQIITEFAKNDSRIVPVFKNNSGVSDTRNKGLEIAKGDFIGFVDGDDYIEPEMYETLLSNLLENNADISHCGYQMVFPSRVDYYYNTSNKVVQDNLKGIRDLIVGDYIEPGLWNKLYRKDVLKDLRMSESIRINEDVLFNFYAFCNSNKSVYEDKPFYHYILRKGSATKSDLNDNLLFDSIKVNREIFEYCSNSYSSLRGIAYKRYFYSIVRLFRTVNIYKLKDKKILAQKYKTEFKDIPLTFSVSKRLRIERFLFLYFNPLHMGIYKLYDKKLSKNKDKYEVK